jgi:hypothetical protein
MVNGLLGTSIDPIFVHSYYGQQLADVYLNQQSHPHQDQPNVDVP